MNYRGLPRDRKNRFVSALKTLKQKGVVDNFAQIHSTYFSSGIHRTSHFLPWHREMLYRFELELQKVDPSVTIPYWESPLDNNTSDEYFWGNDFMAEFNSAWNLRRAPGSATLPTWADVEDVQKRTTYDAFWYGTDQWGTDGLEVRIHNPPHAWVEGEMGGTFSPRDPVFYLHHCWIDMQWALWQRWNPNAAFEARGPSGGSWGENDTMLAWTNPTRTPADVLDHRNKLGYRYDTEDYLQAGDVLHPYEYQYSPTRNYMLAFASGRLYLQTPGGNLVPWTSSGATAGTQCVMNGNGNLVISDNFGRPFWASNTGGHNDAWLSIQDPDPENPADSGHLVIYDTNNNPLDPPWKVPPPSQGNPPPWKR
jgi:tyrosinase